MLPIHRIWGLAGSAQLKQSKPELEFYSNLLDSGMPVAGELLDIAIRVWAVQHHTWVSSEFMQNPLSGISKRSLAGRRK